MSVDTSPLLKFMCRVATHHRHLLHIFDHNRAATNHSTATYMPARGKNQDIGGNPGIIVDGDAVVFMFPFGRIDVMGSGNYFSTPL